MRAMNKSGAARRDRVVLVGAAGHRDDRVDEFVPALAGLLRREVVGVRCPAGRLDGAGQVAGRHGSGWTPGVAACERASALASGRAIPGQLSCGTSASATASRLRRGRSFSVRMKPESRKQMVFGMMIGHSVCRTP